jgi:iron(III) transport system substrate-binding protein
MMRSIVFGLFSALLLISACAPSPTAGGPAAPPTPTAAPVAKPTSAPAAAPTSAAPTAAAQPTAAAAAKPAASILGAAAAKPAAADDWNAVVTGAKAEGKLVLIGPQGSDIQDSLIKSFQKQYPDIQVDYAGMAGSQVPPKVIAEQGAGQFNNDVTIAGAGNINSTLTPANALAPIESFMTGPNTRDTSIWRNGGIELTDPGSRQNIVFSSYPQLAFIYSPNQVNPSEFKSWKDLLNPKWKGKISIGNPKGGAAAVHVVWWFVDPSLGKPFMQDLFVGQQIVTSNDDQQIIDWVARGQYPIGIGPSNTLISEAQRKGLPIGLFDGSLMAEGTYLSAGNGTVSIFRNPPHPNATKLYLDWLLSRDGQYEFSVVQGYASLRLDVQSDHVPPYYIPKDGVKYHPGYGEQYVKDSREAFAFVDTITPR